MVADTMTLPELLRVVSEDPLSQAGLQLDRWLEGCLTDWQATARTETADAPGTSARDLSFSTLAERLSWNRDSEAALRLHIMLGRLLHAATAQPGIVGIAATYLRRLCEAAWERSWDHTPLIGLIRDVATEEHRLLQDSGVAGLITPADRIAIDYLYFLERELHVETAANAGSLSLYAVICEKARIDAELLAERARRSTAGSDVERGLLAMLAEQVAGQLVYYGATASALRSAADFLDGGSDDLDQAEQVLLAAEQSSDMDPIDRSELRAHRSNIQHLRGARSREMLAVHFGSVTCVYPFGSRGERYPDLVRRVVLYGAEWRFAGLAPVVPPLAQLHVSDFWDGEDALDRRYAGTEIALPPLEAIVSADAAPILLQVRIRMTNLGNNQVLVTVPLEDASPTEVFARMWLASPEFGQMTELNQVGLLPADGDFGIRPAGSAAPGGGAGLDLRWSNLSEFVDQALDDLGKLLNVSETGPEQPGAAGENPDPDRARVSISRSGSPGHTIVRVDEAHAVDPMTGVKRPLADSGELATTFGAEPLFHGLPSGISSILPWALPYDAQVGHLPTTVLPGTYLRVTETTTLLCNLQAASSMVDELQEAIEFVAGVRGMFAGWEADLTGYYNANKSALEALATPSITVDHMAEQVRRFEQIQTNLRLFVMSSKVTLLFLASASLVRSPPLRELLDQLLQRSGAWRRRDDFVQTANDVLGDRLAEVIETLARRRADQAREAAEQEKRDALARNAARERSSRRLMDFIIASITALGVSGVLSIVQAGYGLERGDSLILVAGVIAVALAVGSVSYVLSLRSATRESGPDAS